MLSGLARTFVDLACTGNQVSEREALAKNLPNRRNGFTLGAARLDRLRAHVSSVTSAPRVKPGQRVALPKSPKRRGWCGRATTPTSLRELVGGNKIEAKILGRVLRISEQ